MHTLKSKKIVKYSDNFPVNDQEQTYQINIALVLETVVKPYNIIMN